MATKGLTLLVAVSTLAFVISPLLTLGFSGFTPNQFPVPTIDPRVQSAGYAVMSGHMAAILCLTGMPVVAHASSKLGRDCSGPTWYRDAGLARIAL